MEPRRIALVALIVVASCRGIPACGAGALAELVESKGRVERDSAASPRQWVPAEIGAELQRGDGLRTGTASRAVLRVGRNGVLRVDSDTVLRLQLPGDPSTDAAPGVEVETGLAVLEAGSTPLPIATSSGTALLRAGSRLQLTRSKQGMRYEVVFGGAKFREADGQVSELRAGQTIVVGIGMAVLDTNSPVLTAAVPQLDPGRAAQPPSDAGTPAQDSAVAQGRDRVQAVVSGSVRKRARGERTWAELERGAALLGAGDELEVDETGRAELSRGDERATLNRGHYQIGATGAPLVRATDGKLVVSAERTAVVISVPGGTIVAQAAPGGSRADIAVNGADGTTEIEVLAGQVKTIGPQGEAQLEAGEQTRLAAAAAGAPKPVPKAARSTDYAELIVRAGESFRVYDPAPPTSIGFNLGKRCPGGAEVRVEGIDPVRGKRQVNVLVGPGLHSYAVHCIEGGRAERRASIASTLRVLRSDGTRRPPTTAVRNDVDLDGRHYTLMYQNLRPILSVRWPNAKPASSYVLQLERPDGTIKSLRTKQPRVTVEPNLLGDGVHKLRIETATGESSKETKVSLLFDNAAPTASLRQPPPAGFAAGESTVVSGLAVAGSTASIGDRTVPLDRAGRFTTEVSLRPNQRTIAVRFRHAKHGVRYYLRRAADGER